MYLARFSIASSSSGYILLPQMTLNPECLHDRSRLIKYIVSGSWDKTVRLWNLSTGEQVRVLKGHTGDVNSVAVGPGGSVASGSEDGSIILWDLETGKPLTTMVGLTDGEWVAYTPDNYYRASAHGDTYVSFRIENKLYRFEQYAEIYKRPSIVSKVLRGEDIQQAVAKIESETGVQVSKVTPADIRPPEVVIQYLLKGDKKLEPEDQLIDSPEVTLVAMAREPRHGVEIMRIEQNGKLLVEEKGLGKKECMIKVPIRLKDKENTLVIRAYSTKKVGSRPREIHLTYKEELREAKLLPGLAS
jgi:hypothetical protein